MAKNKEEENYDIQEHLKILSRFYLDVTIILGLQKKKRKKIEEVEELLKKTNKRLWPVMMLAVKEDLEKVDRVNEEVYDLLKKKAPQKSPKN
jgi:hypothetical protein